MKKRLLLVDDHQMFLDGLVEILSQEPSISIVGTAMTGNQALEMLKIAEVDIIISDISMPDMDGEELLIITKKDYPTTKTIMLTMHDSGEKITRLIKGGADSYLYKNASKDELLEAIEIVSSGEQFFSPKIQKALFDNLVPGRQATKTEDLKASLTEREIQILVMISEEHTQKEIADKLFISPNTVVYHKRKLMIILDVKSVAGLVRKAVEMKLL
ncbi:MAG: DNA-binding NarL/FixJ family response regulator [Flavobacteriaceae bacterium]|jgi:DNA-binding NarL/FixJ family response regulator